MTEHKVADADAFADGDRVIREIEGTEIGVFRVDGEYHALANYCVHAGGPLCEGRLAGRMHADLDDWEWRYDPEPGVVTCPWHEWSFDLETGEHLLDDRYAVPTYEVVERDGEVFVEL